MVDQKSGQTRLAVKVLRDSMMRATVSTQDYFYHSIASTPFSLGLALASPYQVRGGLQLENINGGYLTIFQFSNPVVLVYNIFSDDRWHVHPDWVYCKYHQHQKFTGPEQNLIHFLEKLTEAWTEGENKWGKPQTQESHHYCEYSQKKRD